MRGTFAQATKYLTDPDKDKECDPDLTSIKNPDKGEIKCDVCGTIVPILDCGATYMVPRGHGRCRICCCTPHRMLERSGFHVRNLDQLLGFTYDLRI